MLLPTFIESVDLKRVEKTPKATRADSSILSEPFAFPSSSYYVWFPAGLGSRSSNGGYWSAHTYSTTGSLGLSFLSTYFSPQGGGYKGVGFAVRCFFEVWNSFRDSSLNYHKKTGAWPRSVKNGVAPISFIILLYLLISSKLPSFSTIITRADSGILSEPFAFMRSGAYYWSSTGLYDRSSGGFYWSLHTFSASSISGSHGQSFASTGFNPQYGGHKGYGFSVRCRASEIMKNRLW